MKNLFLVFSLLVFALPGFAAFEQGTMEVLKALAVGLSNATVKTNDPATLEQYGDSGQCGDEAKSWSLPVQYCWSAPSGTWSLLFKGANGGNAYYTTWTKPNCAGTATHGNNRACNTCFKFTDSVYDNYYYFDC